MVTHPRELTAAAAVVEVQVGADPAAGAEVSVTVPAGKAWELLGVHVQLVQGLTQTPQPILVLDDGTNVLYEAFGASGAQAASTTATYVWGVGLALSALVGTTPNIHATAPLPLGMVLPAGYRIRTSTLGIGANSNYGTPKLYVAEVAL